MSKRVGKFVQTQLDDSGGTQRDLSNSIQAINGMPLTYAEHEAGGFLQDMQYILGRGDSEVTLEFLFDPTATTGTHTVINGIVGGNTGRTLNIDIGNNANPTTGDPRFSGEFVCRNYVVTPDLNGLMKGTATLRPAVGSNLPSWSTVP